MRERKRWLIVAVYAIAMAWVEAAAVFYLRTLSNRIDPYQPDPLPQVDGLAPVELVREAATLIMLFTVSMMAGRNWRSRWGYAAIAFGVWDIFYYVFLKVICGWPNKLSDWDVLFLLPLPWWGPVISPVLIAILMIIWGSMASQSEHPNGWLRSEWKAWGLNFAGILVALYVFMEDSLRAAPEGADAVRAMQPTRFFNWPLFCVALGLMAAPIVHLGQHLWPRRSPPPAMETNPTT